MDTGVRRFGIIDCRLLAQVPDVLAGAVAISHDGEDIAGRVGRRERRWTPVPDTP
jgi:hypothetical protein